MPRTTAWVGLDPSVNAIRQGLVSGIDGVNRGVAASDGLALLVLSCASLALVGCGKPPALVAPEARQVTFQLWGQPGEPPAIIQCQQLLEQGGVFEHMQFTELTVRRPFPDNGSDGARHAGVLVLTSPHGVYDRQQHDAVLSLEGPVRFSGEMQGEPLVGAAAYGEAHRAADALELRGENTPGAVDDPSRQVTILFHGRIMRSWQYRIGTIGTGTPQQHIDIDSKPYPAAVADEAPALATALAALPRPLILPGVLPVTYGP
jgi:hypothetical protein